MNDPYKKILDAIVEAARSRFVYIQDGDWVNLDSPIEEVFFAALDAVCRMGSTEVSGLLVALEEKAVESIKAKSNEPYPYGDVRSSFIIEPQKQLEGWRVDFLIHYYDWGYPDRTATWRKLVVECDGHDFHERTKAQAARDRRRDRVGQRDGLTVLRFTGSEIWRDPIGCAEQVIEFYQRGL